MKPILFSLAAIFAVSACHKSESTLDKPSQTDQISLSAFVSSRVTPIEQSFFSSTQITEHTQPQGGNQNRAMVPANINFKYGGDGMCVTCSGMCEVNNLVAGENGTAQVSLIDQTQMQIIPNESELSCAFTSDGYFIVFSNTPLPEELCNNLDLPDNTAIASGVYLASFGEDFEQYTSVIVDLISF